jgi:hypothetical protein
VTTDVRKAFDARLTRKALIFFGRTRQLLIALFAVATSA